MEDANKCPHCKKYSVIKRGSFESKARGKQQRYYCKDCDKKFIARDGFYRMRNSPHKITLCLDLFFKGISTRKVQEHLQAFYPHNSSWVSIYSWIIKYSSMIHKFTNTMPIKSGVELMSDEMEYHRLGKQNWFVDVMDTKTRYMVSSNYMRSRTLENLIEVMKNAKRKIGNQIKIVTTDGLNAYPRVLRRTFGLKTHWRHHSKIIHNVVIASERGFNHKIERLHGSIRERTKITRGFHGSIESAKAIMQGYEVYYNFIRKHQALGKCPYELAIPELRLGDNRWLELIKLSTKTH